MSDEASTLITGGDEGGAADAGTGADTQSAGAADAGAQAGQQQPGTEQNSSEAATGTEGEKAQDDKPQGAPETYEPFSYPDGTQVNEALNGELTSLAKDLNLTQEQAQKLADLGAKQAQSFTQSQEETFRKANEQWANDTRTDKEIGGDNLQDSLSSAKKALDSFGTPELKDLLNGSGFGNHPEVVRLFSKIGKAISEDGFVSGSGKSAPGDARSIYSASNMNP